MASTNNHDNDFLSTIGNLCLKVNKKVPFLSESVSEVSLLKENFVDKTAQEIESWISDSTKVIIDATKKFRDDSTLDPPKPFEQNKLFTLFPSSNEPASALCQVILWSLLNDECHESIVKSLMCAKRGKDALPQKSSDTSAVQLWAWLQSCVYCTKSAVKYSCKSMRTKAAKDESSYDTAERSLLRTIIPELCFASSAISRSVMFFSLIGIHAIPLHCLARPIPGAQLKHSSIAHDKDMVLAATKQYLNYLKSKPKVETISSVKAVVGKRDVSKWTLPSCDILTFMLQHREILNQFQRWRRHGCSQQHISGGKACIPQKNKALILKENRMTEDEKFQSPLARECSPKNNDLATYSDISPKLQALKQKISIKFGTERAIQAQAEKIAGRELTELYRKSIGHFAPARIAALSASLKALLKRENPSKLSLGERVLVKVFSEAMEEKPFSNVNHGTSQLQQILQQLSETLFAGDKYTVSIAQAKYKVPVSNDLFWKTHFEDICENCFAECQAPMKRGKRKYSILKKENEGKKKSFVEEKQAGAVQRSLMRAKKRQVNDDSDDDGPVRSLEIALKLAKEKPWGKGGRKSRRISEKEKNANMVDLSNETETAAAARNFGIQDGLEMGTSTQIRKKEQTISARKEKIQTEPKSENKKMCMEEDYKKSSNKPMKIRRSPRKRKKAVHK